tara:strand:+ start:108373 stop:108477 length:105 start_codon:yes stop_codon:yes gene_type:complete
MKLMTENPIKIFASSSIVEQDVVNVKVLGASPGG